MSMVFSGASGADKHPRVIHIDGHQIPVRCLPDGSLMGEAEISGVRVWPMGRDLEDLTGNARLVLRNLGITLSLPQANRGGSA